MPSATRVHSHESQVYIDSTLIRGVQSFSYENPKNVQELRKLGSYKIEDHILTADQPIDASIDFIVNNHVLGRTGNYLKFLSSDESTLKLKDATAETTFSKANLTSFSLDCSIGNFVRGSYGYQCDSLSVSSSDELEDSDLDSSQFNVFRPQDITLTTTLAEGKNSTDFPIQSISLSVGIERRATIRVGERGAKRRYPVLPAQGSLEISIIKNNVEDTMDLSNLVTEKGNFTFLIAETALGTTSTNTKVKLVVHDCFLNSVNHSHDLDGNATLNFSYSFPISNDSVEYYFPDPDATTYIGLLESDGVILSYAKKKAIETFYTTAKDEGWYSSLKRLYLPIWGSVGPNSRCLVSGTSGEFQGSFHYATGYAHPTAASGANRFNTGYKLLDDDLTLEDACLMALAYQSTPVPADDYPRAFAAPNHTIIGSGATAATSIRISSASSSMVPVARWNGVYSRSLATYGSHGVLLANRKSGETTLHRRIATGIHEDSTTGTGGSSYQNFPIVGFGSSSSTTGSNTQSTTTKSGAFGISNGLDATDRSAYTDAVKTLWESCSGLTLTLTYL